MERSLEGHWGFPTLNIAWPENKLVPAHGVYLCRVQIDGEEYPGIANIGIKPTVTEEKRLLIESFLFGYSRQCIWKKCKDRACGIPQT